MILVADSGSTKAEWRLGNEKGVLKSFRTGGINPVHMNEDAISKVLPEIPDFSFNDVKNIFFYGAGCATEDAKQKVQRSLSKLFSSAQIDVDSDLAGAARGLCGGSQGIVAILGTGSNACMYDGNNIRQEVPSLGYILGDEGSGADLGRRLLKEYFYRQLPEVLSTLMRDEFNLTKDEVIEHVYRLPGANRYLAGFAKFIYKHLDYPEVQDIVRKAFESFIDIHVAPYDTKSYLLNVTGSIAWNFSDLLKEVASERGIKTGKILKDPADALAEYHRLRLS